MTSEGSEKAWPLYGPVAAAKAALECYVRQLGREMAQHQITVNAILAGVTNTPALNEPLTARETEVVRLMSGGYSNREIAQALRNSEGTIKNHVSSILAKLAVRDRTRAVLKAIELRLI